MVLINLYIFVSIESTQVQHILHQGRRGIIYT